MDKKTIVAVTSLICLTVGLVSAHSQGIDGAVTSGIVGLMGVIAGSIIGFGTASKKSKQEE